MSKYQAKINLLQEKINKLKEQEIELTKGRKVFVGDLAEKLDLLIYSDACLAGMLSQGKEMLSASKHKIAEFETRGQDFFQGRQSQLLQVIRKLARIIQRRQRLVELDRKADTRRKIQLGGLIIKAGLADEKSTILYGLLLEAAETLIQEGNEARFRWKLKGDIGFME